MTEEIDDSLEINPPDGSRGTNSAAGPGGARGGAAVADPGPDLATELARTLARTPLEQITCRRVGEHHYRCNWWTPQDTRSYDNPSMLGSLVTTSRISKSAFLPA